MTNYNDSACPAIILGQHTIIPTSIRTIFLSQTFKQKKTKDKQNEKTCKVSELFKVELHPGQLLNKNQKKRSKIQKNTFLPTNI